MKRQPRFIYLLNSCQRRLQQCIALHGNGLSSAQGGVLFLLEREDGSLMGRLAQQLDLAPSAVSGLIDRMQKSGLVVRRPCSEDGRAQRVWLTDGGRAQLPTLKAQVKSINGLLQEGFSRDELEIVERWLQQVHDRLVPPTQS